MEKSSQIAWKFVLLRHFFPLKVVPLIEVLLYVDEIWATLPSGIIFLSLNELHAPWQRGKRGYGGTGLEPPNIYGVQG
jgi:hypothetical protein